MRFGLFLALASLPLSAQVANDANSGYRTTEGRARVAKTLAADDRDGRQKPKELVDAMELKVGSTVVDLGTGVGYMLPFLSRAVGPTGKVIAMDIFPDFLGQAKTNASKANLSNVEFVAGTDKDPNLGVKTADVVFTLDAYHHFDFPALTLAGVAKALRPGGRFILVDFYKSGFRDPKHIRLDQADVIKEVEANGFRFVKKMDHQPEVQYIAIFEKRD